MAVDNSLRIWLLEGDPALRSYRAFQQRFGNDEVVIIAVRDSAATLLTPANQRRLDALSTALPALPARLNELSQRDFGFFLGPAAAAGARGGAAGHHHARGASHRAHGRHSVWRLRVYGAGLTQNGAAFWAAHGRFHRGRYVWGAGDFPTAIGSVRPGTVAFC